MKAANPTGTQLEGAAPGVPVRAPPTTMHLWAHARIHTHTHKHTHTHTLYTCFTVFISTAEKGGVEAGEGAQELLYPMSLCLWNLELEIICVCVCVCVCVCERERDLPINCCLLRDSGITP